MPTLTHSSLRAMWQGLFDQNMADTFVRVNLMNTSRFWTKMPLPSISADDPHFAGLGSGSAGGNNWSGPPEGLTLQRAIRALEAYGHYAESVLVGLALTDSLLKGCDANGSALGAGAASGCHFPQEINPFTAVPLPGTGYGPMMLSLLEYTARRLGITPLADGVGGALLLSALHLAEGNAVATQRLGDRVFSLASERGTDGVVQANATMGRGDSPLFRLTCRAADSSAPLVGVRVVAWRVRCASSSGLRTRRSRSG